MIELRMRGLEAESHVALKVHYKDNLVGEYIVDMLLEDKVIVKLT